MKRILSIVLLTAFFGFGFIINPSDITASALTANDITLSLGIPQKNVNLSAPSHVDWIHFGAGKNIDAVNRKRDSINTGSPVGILNEAVFNGIKSVTPGKIAGISDEYSVSFSDGIPTASWSGRAGVFGETDADMNEQGVATATGFEIPITGTGVETELKIYFETQSTNIPIDGTNGVACKIDVIDNSGNIIKTMGTVGSTSTKDARTLSVKYSTSEEFKIIFTRLGSAGFVSLLAYTLSYGEDIDGFYDYARNKEASAYSRSFGATYLDAFNGYEFVYDKNSSPEWGTGNFWNSALLTDGPQWLMVDLGRKCRIEAFHTNWVRNGIYEYYIEVSDDGTTWNTVVDYSGAKKHTTNNRSERHYMNDVIGRYARITILSLNLSGRAGLHQFSVYGGYVPTNLPSYELKSDVSGNKLSVEIVRYKDFSSLPEIVTAVIAAYDANGNYLKSEIRIIKPLEDITIGAGEFFATKSYDITLGGVSNAAEYKGYLLDNIFSMYSLN